MNPIYHVAYGTVIALLAFMISMIVIGHRADRRAILQRLHNTEERLLSKVYKIHSLQAELILYKGESKQYSNRHKVISVEPPRKPKTEASENVIQPYWIHSGVDRTADSGNTCSSSSSDSDSSSSSSSSGGCE